MIRRRPAAVDAIIEQAEYIGVRSPAAAARFIDAVEETLKQLVGMPGMGHRYETEEPRLAGIRIWFVKGFPNHLLFYRPIDGGIELIHLLHGARNINAVLADELDRGEL